MTKKKQDEIMPYVISGGIIIAYFGIIRPVMKKIGIVKSEETKKVEQYESQPAEKNPFTGKYFDYHFKNLSAHSPKSWYDAYTDLDAKKFKKAPNLTIKLLLLQDIDNAFGYVYDDEEEIIGKFRGYFADKLSLSYFAKFVEQRMGKDLLTYLKTGKNLLPANGLNDSELLRIIRHINTLPDYIGQQKIRTTK